MKETNFVEKNSEFARLFGIQFEDVLYRGSQQRVESQMFRIARRNGFIIASPSDHNIKAMRALRHPNIVRLLEVLQSNSSIYVVMDFVPGGELFDYVKRNGPCSVLDSYVLPKYIVS